MIFEKLTRDDVLLYFHVFPFQMMYSHVQHFPSRRGQERQNLQNHAVSIACMVCSPWLPLKPICLDIPLFDKPNRQQLFKQVLHISTWHSSASKSQSRNPEERSNRMHQLYEWIHNEATYGKLLLWGPQSGLFTFIFRYIQKKTYVFQSTVSTFFISHRCSHVVQV